MRKQIKSHINDIISDFEINLVPMIKIAEKYQCSRIYIHRILKNHGVDTSKHKITVSCSCCQAPISRVKSLIRNRKNLFCSTKCYYAWINARNEEYIPSRTGNRIARSVISAMFPLQPYHIVHHKDNNTHNNKLDNLIVFSNQGDHIRHHRGLDVIPIWGSIS